MRQLVRVGARGHEIGDEQRHHAGRRRSTQPVGRILHRDAVARIDAEPLRGEQHRVRASGLGRATSLRVTTAAEEIGEAGMREPLLGERARVEVAIAIGRPRAAIHASVSRAPGRSGTPSRHIASKRASASA